MKRTLAAIVVVLGVLAGPGVASSMAAFSVDVQPVTTAEGGTFTVSVTRSLALGDASVTVRTGNLPASPPDSAVAPADYTAVTTTLNWTVLSPSTQTVPISTADDTLDEEDGEVFTVRLSDELGDTVTARSRTVTITDNDEPPTLTIGDATVAEGTAATPTVLGFPLTLSAASGRTVTANYATAGGTAVAGQDYTEKSGTVSIPAGATTSTIHVNVVADDVVEQNEAFTMTLTATDPANVTVAPPGTATGTITNDDTLPTLSIAGPAPTTEGSTGLTTNFDFVISLSKPLAQEVIVGYATADGTASAPTDYTPVENTVTFAPGETSKVVQVPVLADTLQEGNENFSVSLDTATLTATVGSATAIIVDDDGIYAPPKPADPAPAPAPVTRDVTPPALKLSKITSSRGVMRITVTCPAGEQVCRGTLNVFNVPARKSKVKALRREIKLASSLFVIPGGQQAKLTLRPSKRVARYIRQARTVRARAYAVARDAAGNIGTVQARGTVRAG
jgi:hypothetical protein